MAEVAQKNRKSCTQICIFSFIFFDQTSIFDAPGLYDRRSAYFTARLQQALSAGVRSRLTVGIQWLEAGRATSCWRWTADDVDTYKAHASVNKIIARRAV